MSASSLEREAACPGSAALPNTSESGDDAARGQAIHAFLERVGRMPLADALAGVPKQWREFCGAIDTDQIVGGLSNVRSEVAYAIRIGHEEAREIGSNIGRAYPDLGDDWEFGTNDIEGVRFDGVPVTGDIKTGNDVTPARDNMQAQFAARAIQLVTGADEVESRIIYLRHSGDVWVDWHVFTRLELERFEDRVSDVRFRVADAHARYALGVVPDVNPGSWCRYCPGLLSCPAKTALARSMLSDLESVDARIATFTPEQAGRAYLKLKEILTVAERVESALKQFAARTPLPLGNGKEIRPITFEKKSFSRTKALELLAAKGATVPEIEALKVPHEETHYRVVNAKRSA